MEIVLGQHGWHWTVCRLMSNRDGMFLNREEDVLRLAGPQPHRKAVREQQLVHLLVRDEYWRQLRLGHVHRLLHNGHIRYQIPAAGLQIPGRYCSRWPHSLTTVRLTSLFLIPPLLTGGIYCAHCCRERWPAGVREDASREQSGRQSGRPGTLTPEPSQWRSVRDRLTRDFNVMCGAYCRTG